ncbi:MAG: hypothetical protein EOM62_12600 [Bacteroidia bacterium]|nr:hypothetical protein [Bacteroidia bacterium]
MKIQLQTYHFQIAVKEVKDLGQDGVEIEGYASTPDIDRYKDIVEPAAFSNALTLFMKNPSLLRSHDPDRPAGHVVEARITDKGLWIRALVTEEETKKDVIENRFRAFSIGYIPLESTLQHEDGTPFNAEVDSPWDKDMVRVIKKLDLVEISIVSTPANGNALFTIARSVKQYFNQLVTKSMLIKKEAGENEVPEKTEEEIAAEKAAAEETAAKAEEGGEQPEAEQTDEEKAAEVQAKKDAEAAEDKPKGEEPEEEAEKGAGSAPADGGEAKTGEEPNAEAKPEEKPEEAKPEAGEAIGVDSETAKSLPELVQAGLFVESKDAGALNLPKSVTNLIAKMLTSYKELAEKAAGMEAKLANIPEKRALTVMGQYEESKELAKDEKKEASPEFMAMFGMKK